jgi:ABC-type branched-subunit amino acid transport system substrate-binding protein
MNRLILSSLIIFCLCAFGLSQALAAGVTFNDPAKISDMSDFDPNNPIIPEGDTIKIAIVASFSGPAALVGHIYFISAQWAAHDINKRGGILVDGKRKKVQIIKANHESKPAIAKKVCERMVLQEKVHVLWGTNGSHLMKVINQVADKYKVIAQCAAALSDELYDAKNFTRYSFMTSFQTTQI